MNSPCEKDSRRVKKTKPTGADGHRSRMFDQFIASGGHDFTDRDLIEMMLFFVNRIRDTRDIAVDLIEAFNFDIGALLAAKSDELQKIDGIGNSSAQFLEVVGELVYRLEESVPLLREPYTDTKKIGELFSRKHFCHSYDTFWAAFFDDDMRFIAMEKLKDDLLSPEDSDCISSIITLAATFRSTKVAVARLSRDFTCYPALSDFNTLKHINSILSNTGVSLIEYFIATPDDSFALIEALSKK